MDILPLPWKRFDKMCCLYYTIHIKALIRISSNRQSHTERCRVMRGPWKTCYEYLFEPHTQRKPDCYALEITGAGYIPVGYAG